MSTQDPATHARARQSAAFRYDAARRQLALTIKTRAKVLVPAAPPRGETRDLAARRAALVAQAIPLVDALGRYVRDQIELAVAGGTINVGEIDPEDVVIATYLAAAEQAQHAPPGEGLYPWLRRVARRQVAAAAGEAAERREREERLDINLSAMAGEWPEEVVQLVEVLADPTAIPPETALARERTRRALNSLLERLPERWREVFLLKTLDGWPDHEIAAIEGLEVWNVPPIVEASRAFLREWLREARNGLWPEYERESRND